MTINTSLKIRIHKAIDVLPPAHLLPLSIGEMVTSLEKGKIRLQDYVFNQEFCLMVKIYDKKRQRLIMKCSRHKKKTRNTRKVKKKNKKKSVINVAFIDCRYRVKITFRKKREKEEQWQIIVLKDEHNHSMILDSFVFSNHKDRDPYREKTMQLTTSLRSSFIKYKQTQRIMKTQRLDITSKEYYNLIKFIDKKISQEQLTLILKTVELKNFHVRCLKKYVMKNDVRKHQVIELFFFCNTLQIRFARRFVSDFVIQTDATFNTNHLNMPLSVLMSITNTVKSFAVAYCFVSSESIEVFIFINSCIRDLIFHDDCSESAVMLGDFS